ncbi:MAG: serine/threonine protein kinase, partial [Deltaproteobacteria bacterium]|nr:serine/threonine protein kinase [Deltaproteobacteria bacterium]MBW2535091.1 serine/threonine protein kinase [Deltaproteobacteria bacterium]
MSADSSQDPNLLDGVPKPGEVLAGKYRVERVLGVGGMGAVVAATHVHLDQSVAIKFLTSESARDPRRVERFSREAWAAAKIKSDHIARVSDVGALPDGTPYMVMEHLEGEDLEETLRRGPLPIERAVSYLLQAAEALAEAHQKGIIHRDLKPGNLFVTKRADGSDWIKVLDFGISKITSGGQSLTQTSALLGSPLYMAPEQLASSKYVDHRADIWALGVVLFELISGVPPFVEETLPQVCLRILQGEPTPLLQVVPNAPPGLDAVLRRCLTKDPAERFRHLAELARALVPFGGADAPSSSSFIAKVMSAPGAISTADEEVPTEVKGQELQGAIDELRASGELPPTRPA